MLVVTLKVPGMRAIGLFARQKLNGRMAALLATTALIAAAALLPDAAHAQDATWLGGTPGGLAGSDYNNAVNWSNQAGPPAGTAFFGATASFFNSVVVDGTTTVGGWTFKAGPHVYTFDIAGNAQLDFTGTGITVNGGSAAIVNENLLNFHNTSTAGSADITNNNNGIIQFSDTSTAGSAAITKRPPPGILQHQHGRQRHHHQQQHGLCSSQTPARPAAPPSPTTPTASGLPRHQHGRQRRHHQQRRPGFLRAPARPAAPPSPTGIIQFFDTTAGPELSATPARPAAPPSPTAASLQFFNTSTAGSAAITNGASAITDFSGSSGPHGDHKLSAGSLAGDGFYRLGANELTVGSNNFSTTVTGVIVDGGIDGGTGGSLVKTGTGTLTLSGVNTYTGGTTIDGGTLQLGSGGTSGSIVGDVADRGVLAFNRSDAVTFGGVISGTGAVNQLGPGTTTLTGLNTYTGGTTISAGTLRTRPTSSFGADRGVLTFNGGRVSSAG